VRIKLMYRVFATSAHKDFSVEVEFMNNKALFTPEEISSAVLAKMKEIAQDYLGHPVSRAVITGILSYVLLSPPLALPHCPPLPRSN